MLGGTFDPPHIGHVEIARAVRSALLLDEVLLVVANDPWQKSGSNHISPAEDRLAMVASAVDGINGLRASSIEIDRGGPSYMIDTLSELADAAPDDQFFLILGADAAAGIPTWERHEQLPPLATLVIVDRPGVDPIRLPPDWKVIHLQGPGMDVTSSRLREALEQGEMDEAAIAPAVREYITRHELYTVHHV